MNALSPQSDKSCRNADRVYLGTNKGLIEEYTDFDAVCGKSDLLALAEARMPKGAATKRRKYGKTIPVGQRHSTLLSFASSVLTKYGIGRKSRDAFVQYASRCETPLPEDELERIWEDACVFYKDCIATNPAYQSPEDYGESTAQGMNIEPGDYTDVGEARVYIQEYGGKSRYSEATK